MQEEYKKIIIYYDIPSIDNKFSRLAKLMAHFRFANEDYSFFASSMAELRTKTRECIDGLYGTSK